MTAMVTETAVLLHRMLLAGRELQASLARGLGMRLTDMQAVDQVVSAQTPLGTVELGIRLGITSASATALVDRLVAAGRLTRTPDSRDRRRVAIAATEHAREEIRQALRPLVADVAAITGRLDERELATVMRFLADVTSAIRARTAAPDYRGWTGSTEVGTR